ncbi:MAG: FAD-linked oxidase C-terminal domain-containing protein, partial [Burkholderiaceae bacterium]
AYLASTRSAVEIELMRGLRQTFDPLGIMNPGKLFDPA